MTRILLCLVALTAIACEDPLQAQCDLAATASPTVTIGTGEDGFTAVGDAVSRSFGMQGGSHVWLALRTTGLAPGRGQVVEPPVLEATLTQGGVEVGAASGLWEPLQGDGTAAEIAGIEVFLYDEYWYDDALATEAGFDRDAPVTLSVTLTDACGTTASDEVDFVLDY